MRRGHYKEDQFESEEAENISTVPTSESKQGQQVKKLEADVVNNNIARRGKEGRENRRSQSLEVLVEDIIYPNASSAALQAQVAPSLGAHVSSRTIRSHLAEGHLGSRYPLRVLPLTPTHQRVRLKWCHARGNWTAAEWNKVMFSDESRFNLRSDDNRARVWRPRGNASIMPLLYCDTLLPQLV
ncbi:transposable element Tcb2 transposase [Trichonephila clavipes]|nr:transposable element Tcb2 transposase [Trichonephila clavipes]